LRQVLQKLLKTKRSGDVDLLKEIISTNTCLGKETSRENGMSENKTTVMNTLIIIYLVGVLVAFTINCVMFVENKSRIETYEMDLSDKTLTTVMSLIGAFLSWFFLIMLVLSRKNSYLANRMKQFFENYSMHD
jgi:NADH:ubiquinone oxidoreductase subunit 6 (subunit J)